VLLAAICLAVWVTAGVVQAGSDVRSPDYWRESPNRWQDDQWRQSPVNNRNAPYRWNQEKWRQNPNNWRNRTYRPGNAGGRPPQDWRSKPYKWDKEKWSNDPNNWRNKAYRFDKQRWRQNPLNWQNSPYRWGAGEKQRNGEIDIQMNFEGRKETDPSEKPSSPMPDGSQTYDDGQAPTEDKRPTGPRIVEVGKGAPGTPGRYSGRVLPVIRIHGTTPSATLRSDEKSAQHGQRPKQLNGFAVYGLER
jgi:hypothetical protein